MSKQHAYVLLQGFYGTYWDLEGQDSDAVPSLQQFPLHTHAIPVAFLAVGAGEAVVVSEHGHDLAQFTLAHPPVQPALIADFNGDGLNDIIVVTSGGVFGYAQVHQYGSLSLGALLLTLIIAMGVVWYTQQYEAGGQRTRKLRSTEYTD